MEVEDEDESANDPWRSRRWYRRRRTGTSRRCLVILCPRYKRCV